MVTVKELQAQLKKRGLETKGLKAELTKRLEEAENQEKQATEEASAAGEEEPDAASDTKLQEPNAAATEVVAAPIAQSAQETKTNQSSAEEQKPASAEEQKKQTSADDQKSKSTDKDTSAPSVSKKTAASNVATMLEEELDYEDEDAEEIAVPEAAEEAAPPSKRIRSSPAPSRTERSTNQWKREAKQPPSAVLLIKNFVRPFTVQQAKDFLGQNGTLKTFWMDTIRTHCFATFETEEQAQATREAVDGVEWPLQHGRRLHADFSTEEDAGAAAAGPISPRMRVTSPRTGGSNRGDQPNPRQAANKPEPAKPVRRLGDLFRKTSAKPAIYWVEAQQSSAQ